MIIINQIQNIQHKLIMDETKIYIHVILALTPLHLVEEDLVISFFVLKKNNV